MRTLKARNGFTVVELLFVLVIFGLLHSVALPTYRKCVAKVKQIEAKLVLVEIGRVNQFYFEEMGVWYTPTNNLGPPVSCFREEALGPLGFDFECGNSNYEYVLAGSPLGFLAFAQTPANRIYPGCAGWDVWHVDSTDTRVIKNGNGLGYFFDATVNCN
jgi:prepilin-type N-terminal cleavage/methylation domain-containing protein